MKRKRKRAIALKNNTVAEERYQLYSKAWSRIQDAITVGFYLEAIALTESLIADRLESRLTFLKGRDFSFRALGQLIEEACKIEVDQELLDAVTSELDAWRIARNKAAHEMVKIEKGQNLTWTERLALNEAIAQKGLHLLRRISSRVNELIDMNVESKGQYT